MADLEAFDWSNPHRSEKMNFARNLHERIGFCIGIIGDILASDWLIKQIEIPCSSEKVGSRNLKCSYFKPETVNTFLRNRT